MKSAEDLWIEFVNTSPALAVRPELDQYKDMRAAFYVGMAATLNWFKDGALTLGDADFAAESTRLHAQVIGALQKIQTRSGRKLA